MEQILTSSLTSEQGICVLSSALFLTSSLTSETWLLSATFRRKAVPLHVAQSCLDVNRHCTCVLNREMGCVCEKAKGMESPLKQYRVMLLPPGSGAQPPKKLADAFPKLALARAKRK